jgi:hypothetical protein
MMVCICEVAYVISFICTTYSRFTSTMFKRSRYLLLLGDSKCAVELAGTSARFRSLCHTIPLGFLSYIGGLSGYLSTLMDLRGSILDSFIPPKRGVFPIGGIPFWTLCEVFPIRAGGTFLPIFCEILKFYSFSS